MARRKTQLYRHLSNIVYSYIGLLTLTDFSFLYINFTTNPVCFYFQIFELNSNQIYEQIVEIKELIKIKFIFPFIEFDFTIPLKRSLKDFMESIDPFVGNNKENTKIGFKQICLKQTYNADKTHVKQPLLWNLQQRNLLLITVNNSFTTVAMNDAIIIVKGIVVPATLSLG